MSKLMISVFKQETIYQEVFTILDISGDSEKAEYIKSHIKITNFRDLELIAFGSNDVFIALTRKRDTPDEWNDMCLFNQSYYNSCKHKKYRQ